MNISDILFTLLIGPIKILFELIYILIYRLTLNPGLSIIGLSLVMNFMLLPLYNRTDAIQQEAIATEKRLKPYVDHIKKAFHGDEQFMILQTCYRQNHYKPTDALKGISPLLLEIPFFMAAYSYLSGLSLLYETPFGPIPDLYLPDGLLKIGSVSVNVLPILMTAINILSSMIYTKDAPLKSKIQLYGMALLFLILLYDSPSGLVFYWTLNNLFSLIKNVFMRLENPRKVLNVLSSAAGVLILVCVPVFRPLDSLRKSLFVAGVCIVLQLPAFLSFLQKKRKLGSKIQQKPADKTSFLLNCLFLTILMGVLIPSSVIRSSPAEFVGFPARNPLYHVMYTTLISAGAFLIWVPVFYMLSGSAGKRLLGMAAWILAGMTVVDYMFFGADYGTLSSNLRYLEDPDFSGMLLNGAAVLTILGISILMWFQAPKLIRSASGILCLAVLLMSLANFPHIQKVYMDTVSALDSSSEVHEDGIVPLNRNGKNVVVLMMDRAIGAYTPYIMNERPELRDQFDGFTYFPNTMSYGLATNVGTPPLFGGYDYRPEEINSRKEESLAEKQNEALKVMPVMFLQDGFHVTVCDPTYAGYQWIPDLSIYSDYPEIDAYHATMVCRNAVSDQKVRENWDLIGRNFFCYSLFRCAPVMIQPVLYNNGNYNYVEHLRDDSEVESYLGNGIHEQTRDGLLKGRGIFSPFYEHYNVLNNLPMLTRIQDEDQNTFLMMSNDTTHEPMLLQEPEYIPAMEVDNTEYELSHGNRYGSDGEKLAMNDEQQVMHYQINMAAMIQLGKWFDFLRENNVYDNTRIIIVADHGRGVRQIDHMIFGSESYQDAMYYNPLLMVKDFGSTGFTEDETFMTNADVPTIAAYGLIENPVNPFTGNAINTKGKLDPVRILYTEWDTEINNGNTFMDGHWLTVHDDVRDKNNWREITEEMKNN